MLLHAQAEILAQEKGKGSRFVLFEAECFMGWEAQAARIALHRVQEPQGQLSQLLPLVLCLERWEVSCRVPGSQLLRVHEEGAVPLGTPAQLHHRGTIQPDPFPDGGRMPMQLLGPAR